MLEYINFVLLCVLLNFLGYIYFRVRKYLPLLKMTDQAIDKLISEGYDIPGEFPKSDDSKKQKLLECIHMGNSKQYLGKVYTEDQINKLSLQETS